MCIRDCNKIIYPEQDSGEDLAHSLFNENVIEYMDLTLDYGISKIKVPDHLIGSTLKDIGAEEQKRKYQQKKKKL